MNASVFWCAYISAIVDSDGDETFNEERDKTEMSECIGELMRRMAKGPCTVRKYIGR
jgi:hypothetical protein